MANGAHVIVPNPPPPSSGGSNGAAVWFLPRCAHRRPVSGGLFGVTGSGPHCLEEDNLMLYMVLENFKDGAVPDIYRRARREGSPDA
jgi:hypothetical protein